MSVQPAPHQCQWMDLCAEWSAPWCQALPCCLPPCRTDAVLTALAALARPAAVEVILHAATDARPSPGRGSCRRLAPFARARVPWPGQLPGELLVWQARVLSRLVGGAHGADSVWRRHGMICEG